MRRTGLADHGPASGERGPLILPPLLRSLLPVAGIMLALSFVLVPLAVRYLVTPLIFFWAARPYAPGKRAPGDRWQNSESRELAEKMHRLIKTNLRRSETLRVKEDLTGLVGLLLPEEEEGASLEKLRLSFSPVRLLETLLLAYEDLYRSVENHRLPAYLLNRRIKWYRPFLKGIRCGRRINRHPLLGLLNRRGLPGRLLRLALLPLIPLAGLPGLLFYALRSLLLRGLWAGLIRYYYARFLLRTADYLISLYGGETENLARRRREVSREEIIRKGRHYDRELKLVPAASATEELLDEMSRAYTEILEKEGFAPDPVYSGRSRGEGEKPSRRKRWKRRLKQTLAALNEGLGAEEERPCMRSTAAALIRGLAAARFAGRPLPWQNYRIGQGVDAAHKLLLIALAQIYTNAPGSRFALEKIPVDLIRRVREFTRTPLVNLASRTGRRSYRALKPLLQLRKYRRLARQPSPAGLLTLSAPLLGRLLRDRWKEQVLYRLGRALIRGSLSPEKELSPP